MSSSRIFRLALPALCAAVLPLLGGCGFTPLYGRDSAGHAPSTMQEFASIEIPPMTDKIGLELRNLLIDALHPSGASHDYRYKLTAATKEAVVGLGLQENATTTRGQVRLTVKYSLIDEQTGKTVLTETLRSSTGYNVLVNQFSSLLSQDDAETQALQEISEDMTQHLALYFKTVHEKPAGG